MSIDLLHDKIRKLKNPVIIDFSIKPELLPAHLTEQEGTYAKAYIRFCEELLEGFAGIVPGVRFKFDAFALLGKDGLTALECLLKRAGELGFYTLLDGPQILSPWDADAAAAAILSGEEYPCDGLMICPYIGSDAIRPFLPYCVDGQKDLFIAVRSPNKSASELQDLLSGKRLVHGAAAEIVNRFGDPIFTKCGYSRIASVVSAGASSAISTLRSQYKRMFLLVDGIDYPSGNAKNCSLAFDRFGYGAAVSVGPTITASWRDTEGENGLNYVDCAIQAAERIKKNLLRYFAIL